MPIVNLSSVSVTQTSSEDIVLPSGEQVYDSIMSRIEPELILSNLDALDEPYTGETKEAHDARYARYSKAFIAYREQYNVWIQNLSSAMNAYKKAVVRASEKITKADDDSEIESLSSQMLSA